MTQIKKTPHAELKPFDRGAPLDKSCAGQIVRFFVYILMTMLAVLLLGVMLNMDFFALRLMFNLSLEAVVLMIYYQTGATNGTQAVMAGEFVHQRKSSGRNVEAAEEKACYHPLKGFLVGLLGSLPLLIAAVILSVITKRQMTGIGALPTWVSSLKDDVDGAAALAYYFEGSAPALESILRLIVRSFNMPFVSIIGQADKDALYLLEKVSPLLCLLPTIAYGLGYMAGVPIRARVHENIAEGKRKARRKQKKEQKARAAKYKGPEQLN